MNASYHAGDITYKWLFGYTYQIKYTSYTNNVSPDDYCTIDSVCFGDGTNGSLTRINGPMAFCAAPARDGVAISPSIKMNEYITTHTYPGPGNYKMCFLQPNRNPGIINMANSVNQTISFESLLVISTFIGPNTSPKFINHPIAYGCLNNGCFTYNPLATDIDGDSLAYKLLPCTGYGQIPSYAFPTAGVGGTFSIDSVTALLSWCNPQLSGDYNVAIKIEEWRKNTDGDYILIGYVIRDTQFTIDNCTGIDDRNTKNTEVLVYPNPAKETITISLSKDKYTIELYDVTGRKLKTVLNNESLKEESLQIQLDNINPGIYFIKIINSDKTITKKFIKQ